MGTEAAEELGLGYNSNFIAHKGNGENKIVNEEVLQPINAVLRACGSAMEHPIPTCAQ